MALFYLVRHGEPDWPFMCSMMRVGPANNLVPLTKKGIAQIEQTARDPRLSKADCILASPYTRAMQTAQILSLALAKPVTVEFDLHEWLYHKDWNDCSYRHDDAHIDLCYCHRYDAAPDPGDNTSESVADVAERARAVLRRYAGRDSVIVACHEGVIRSLTDLPGVAHGQIVEYRL